MLPTDGRDSASSRPSPASGEKQPRDGREARTERRGFRFDPIVSKGPVSRSTDARFGFALTGTAVDRGEMLVLPSMQERHDRWARSVLLHWRALPASCQLTVSRAQLSHPTPYEAAGGQALVRHACTVRRSVAVGGRRQKIVTVPRRSTCARRRWAFLSSAGSSRSAFLMLR